MRTRWRAGLPLAAITFSLAAASPSMAVVQKFPNLTTDKPRNLVMTTDVINGSSQYVLRFSNTVRNLGDGPIELRGRIAETDADGRMPARQWIDYELRNVVARQDEWPVGHFQWHAAHSHYHFDDFARYELLTYSNRAQVGQGINEKATFCLMDNAPPPGNQSTGTYVSCNTIIDGMLKMGISVGWGDTYGAWLPGQYVKLGPQPLADGAYVLRSTADPDNLLYESPEKANPLREQGDNSAEVVFDVVNGQVRVR